MAEETTRLRLRTLTEEDYPALALLMDQGQGPAKRRTAEGWPVG